MAISNKGSAVAPFGGIDGGKFPEMYMAQLYAELRDGSVIDLKAPLPENYQFNLATSFDNPFNQPLSNYAGMAGNMAGVAADAGSTGMMMTSGHSTINKWMSGAVWTGGSLFQITVPFVIQAFNDTREEVVKTMRDMLKLVAPAQNAGGFLIAPGPNMASAVGGSTSGDKITIRIGKFFVMQPCVIESVTCDFDTQMDAEGEAPVSATITVNAMSYFATTKEDLDDFFKV
jgi:hypothetical protein